ncbi:MAG: hypothetical protein QM601_09810 [Pseudoxanthomonas sp.]
MRSHRPRPRLAHLLLPAALLAAALLAACASAPRPPTDPLAEAGQLVLVVAPDWDAPAGRLQAFERVHGRWVAHGPAFDVSLGRNGSAWGEGLQPPPADDGPHKREGDGRSPAGVFAIGIAFGYAPQFATGLDYRQMQADSWCVDVSGSPLYNRIVDAGQVGQAAVAGASEHMRLDLYDQGDIRYREGFVIGHNAHGLPGLGSCIFAHLRRHPDEPTAGCTSMEPANMDALLHWLDAGRQPRFVLLPRAQYARLRADWSLPPAP